MVMLMVTEGLEGKGIKKKKNRRWSLAREAPRSVKSEDALYCPLVFM